MKKTISLVLAIAMFICGSISAFATDTTQAKDVFRLKGIVQRISAETGTPMEMVSSRVSSDENFTVYTTLVEPKAKASGTYDGAMSVQSWYSNRDGKYLGDVLIFADFEYTGTSAKITDHNYQSGNLRAGCSYKVSTQGWGNTTDSVEEAYYKIIYTFTYNGVTSPKTNMKISCSKNGDLTDTNDMIYLD